MVLVTQFYYGPCALGDVVAVNRFSPCGALVRAVVRLLYHLSQPAAFFAAFYYYHYYLSELDSAQVAVAWLVCGRQLLSCLAVLCCLVINPGFLLVSIWATLRSSSGCRIYGWPVAVAFLLAPEKFVLVCLLGTYFQCGRSGDSALDLYAGVFLLYSLMDLCCIVALCVAIAGQAPVLLCVAYLPQTILSYLVLFSCLYAHTRI